MANVSPIQLQQWVQKYSKQYNVDPDLVNAMISKESSGNPEAVSDKGAYGYMQLMPNTFNEMLPNGDIKNVEDNIHAGVKYVSALQQQNNGNIAATLASYNAGPGGFNKMKSTGRYAPETVGYVNDPRFRKWVSDSDRLPANPLTNQKNANKFTPEQLNKSALKNSTNQADISADTATMQEVQPKPTNSVVDTQKQYNDYLNQQQMQKQQEEADKKKQAYQKMGLALLSGILGKNTNNSVSVSGQQLTKGYVGNLNPFGNADQANFQSIGNQRG